MRNFYIRDNVKSEQNLYEDLVIETDKESVKQSLKTLENFIIESIS